MEDRSVRIVGRYRLLERIGRGGMAEVWLAVALTGDAEPRDPWAAVKLVLPERKREPGFAILFLREGKIASRFAHPNLARVLDFGIAGDEPFLALELVHGKTLAEVVAAAGRRGLGWPASLSIVRGIAYALHHVHEARDGAGVPLGLVHRDVSPHNVLVAYRGAAKLVDFGIAKATLRAQTTVAGLKGKPGYMAPEQCRCEPVDRRADVFGLGILLYETTLGRRLFAGPNDYEVIGKVLRGEFARPDEVATDYPRALAQIVMRCLALEPEERFATAAELAGAVERFAAVQGMALGEASVRAAMDELFPPASRPCLPATLPSPAPVGRPSAPARARGVGKRGAAILGAAAASAVWLAAGALLRDGVDRGGGLGCPEGSLAPVPSRSSR